LGAHQDVSVHPIWAAVRGALLSRHGGALDNRRAQRQHAHSGSDSVVWVPQARTLFTGDLLFSAIVPAMPPGSNLAAWLRALDTLIDLEPAQVIAGHGPIQSPAALADLRGPVPDLAHPGG
jgi:hypothetical protein